MFNLPYGTHTLFFNLLPGNKVTVYYQSSLTGTL
jgi:hypothetical protein